MYVYNIIGITLDVQNVDELSLKMENKFIW